MSKSKKYRDDIVYSTEAGKVEIINEVESSERIDASRQLLKIKRDTAGRKGKVVTTVAGFVGPKDDLNALGKLLKNKCAVGGTVKNNVIEIQGDFKEKINTILIEQGYRTKLQ